MSYLRFIAATFAVSGCGLIDSDVTNFDLSLPDNAFSVDASGWDINQSEADQILMTPCGGAPTVCMTAATAACPMNCTGECSATTNTCELGLEVSVYKGIDLVMEKPELKQINDRAIIDVTIDSVTYTVTSNTLTVETPEMRVYVAPSSIMDPDDPMAKQIGTIPPVPAMGTVATRDIVFTPDGRALLVDIMSTYKTPFNVIVGSKLVVASGDPVPAGKLDALVKITGHAGL
jgi:hypothetical protein